MKPDEFSALMRQGEAFHGATLPENRFVVLRLDGHGFSRLTETHFSKPFDEKFRDAMVGSAHALIEAFDGVFCWVASDEISLLLPAGHNLFGRRHEKLVSLSAGLVSAKFASLTGLTAAFDSRVWLGQTPHQVIDYFRWRQSEAARCALNGWCYWTLRQQGQSARHVTATLDHLNPDQREELLHANGIEFADLPIWQTRGVAWWWQSYDKTGFDPKRGQNVKAQRRRLQLELDLPDSENFGRWLSELSLASLSAAHMSAAHVEERENL